MDKTVKKMPLILDTDIGDDVDDALALAIALRSPAIDLLGVTTVYKNTGLRAQLAKRLAIVFGRPDLIVCSGAGMPLVNQVDCTEIPPQWTALDETARADTLYSSIHAVDFILETVASHPDLTIVTVGPLTNIALCIQKNPALMRQTRIVVMGGMTTNAYRESNIACDPEASRAVFESGADITLVSLDTTISCKLEKADMRRILESDRPDLHFLANLMEIWRDTFYAGFLRQWGKKIENKFDFGVGMHDPMTVIYTLAPHLFTIKAAEILVETSGEYTRGVTVDSMNVFLGTPTGQNCHLVVKADQTAIANFYVRTVLG